MVPSAYKFTSSVTVYSSFRSGRASVQQSADRWRAAVDVLLFRKVLTGGSLLPLSSSWMLRLPGSRCYVELGEQGGAPCGCAPRWRLHERRPHVALRGRGRLPCLTWMGAGKDLPWEACRQD